VANAAGHFRADSQPGAAIHAKAFFIRSKKGGGRGNDQSISVQLAGIAKNG
jgi:hypothetical protein